MKTHNYMLDLMRPNQMNKDILFNETIIKIDNFLNMSIDDFVDQIPKKSNERKIYIISSGAEKNNIYYTNYDNRTYHIIKAQEGMCFFVVSKQRFYLFTKNGWIAVVESSLGSSAPNLSSALEQEVQEKFFALAGESEISSKNITQCYYLDNNSLLNLGKNTPAHFTVIIKQNATKSRSLLWSTNIIWQEKTPHNMSATLNAIDMISFYKLPESEHFIGHIIAQNYQY